MKEKIADALSNPSWTKAAVSGVAGSGFGATAVATAETSIQAVVEATFLGVTLTQATILAALLASAYSMLCIVALVRREWRNWFSNNGE